MNKQDFIKKYKGAIPDVHGRTHWKTWDEIAKNMDSDLDLVCKEQSKSISTVYVVECGSGGMSDLSWWTSGIFINKKDAEDLRDKLNAKAERIRNDCPVKGSTDDMNEEDENTYWNYYSENTTWMDWIPAEVKERPLNTHFSGRDGGLED